MLNTVDFKTILMDYKVIFFDAYGVIRNYNGVVPGIDGTFDWLKEQQKDYYVVTNDSSRSPELLTASYHRSGFYHVTSDRIISSGMSRSSARSRRIGKGF